MKQFDSFRKSVLERLCAEGFDESESTRPYSSLCDTEKTLFAPLHYEAKYPYPLLIWLHGGTGDNRQLLQIMPKVSLSNYVSVAPRGLPTTEADVDSLGWPQTPEDIAEAEQRVFECLTTARHRFHVNPRRVFLGGFGEGGTMAMRVAWNNPRYFAGAISLCGPLPERFHPFASFTEARRIPLFLAVGRDSLRYSPVQAGENLKLLHTAGINVTLRQYPCGHELSPYMLGDLNEWIMETLHDGGTVDPLDTSSSYRSE